jgi:tRNA nucleotidyltransferase (CCA-adding enzyme)
MKKYLVGGAVREALINDIHNTTLIASDLDYVVTGATHNGLLDLGYKCVGKSFPVYLDPEGNEVAMARTERSTGNAYTDFTVNTEDVTIEEDLYRRDLTISAIAYDEDAEQYIDPYGGTTDIRTKTLKHTSLAFCDDAVRVLRLARLRARFGPYWKIHSSTKLLIDSMRPQLAHLQPDRVYAEVAKVMDAPNSHIFFETLDELQVLDVIFPFIADLKSYREGSVWHKEPNVFEHTMNMLRHADHEPAIIKWMILYHDIAKPLCRQLYGNGAGHDSADLAAPRIDIKLPTKIRRAVLFHIDIHQRIFKIFEGMSPKKIAKLIYSFKGDEDLLTNVIKVSHYDKLGADSIISRPDKSFDHFIATFDEINAYSPYEWIKAQPNQPTPDHIKQHVHQHATKTVRNHLCK